MTRWKAIGWTVAFFVSGIVLSLVVGMVVGRVFPPLGELWFQTIALVFGFGAATWIIGIKGMRWSWTDLRWRGVGAQAKGFGVGFLVGMAPAAVSMVIAVPAGVAGWSGDGGSFAQWLGAVGSIGAVLLPAAFAEELMFRGLPNALLSRSFGRGPAGVVLSLLFGAAHFGNPNVTGLGVVNIVVAGLFLSAAFWLPGGIWAATGAHVGWNLTLAALGAPVSGLPFVLPMLDYRMGGPRWLTGGAFGPEGGALTTVVVGVATVVVAKMVAKNKAASS